MKNKKLTIMFLIIVIIVATLTGIYKIMNSYMVKENSEKKIIDGENKLINHIETVEDNQKREQQIELLLENNYITEDEAREILKKESN